MRKFDLALALGLLLPLTACPGDDSGSDSNANPTTGALTSDTGDPTAGDTATIDTTGSVDETGDPGDGGFCIHQCGQDSDCTIGGRDVGQTCQDGLCAGDPVEPCADDDQCVAVLSGWAFGAPCTMGGGECEPAMQVCLEVDGAGHCVSAPSEFFTCAQASLDEIEVTDIDGNTVTVCGRPDAACHPDGYCYVPCSSDDACANSPATPVCNTSTGFCECATDDHCAANMNESLSVCNGGQCGCGTDQHCVDAGRGDVCNGNGSCGCSADEACGDVQNLYDGGMIVCSE